MPEGKFEILYAMYPGWRRLRFNSHDIEITIQDFAGKFTEQIPLLLGENDELKVLERGCQIDLTRGDKPIMSITVDNASDIKVQDPENNMKIGGVARCGIYNGQKLKPVSIGVTATTNLNYQFRFYRDA